MEDLIHLSEDELLERIGASLESDELGMFPKFPDRRALRDQANIWLRENHALLQAMVCKNAAIQSIRKSPEAELIFDTVCEVLAAELTGIHVGALTAYLIMRGLDRLCESAK